MTEPLAALLVVAALVGGYVLRVVEERVRVARYWREAEGRLAALMSGSTHEAPDDSERWVRSNSDTTLSSWTTSDNLERVVLTHGDGIPPRDCE